MASFYYICLTFALTFNKIYGHSFNVEPLMEIGNADSSTEDDIISTSYVLPHQIFNDGKPYYAVKDSVSGQIDFNDKKPAGIEPEVNEVMDHKEKLILSGPSLNIHDFLNLPVKYSSSKFVYPLVSSSYANLKYQGSNANYITNKKPAFMVAPVTVLTNDHSQEVFTIPTTKLMAVPLTASELLPTASTNITIGTMTTNTTNKPKTSTPPTISSAIKTATLTTTKNRLNSNSQKYFTSTHRSTTVPTRIRTTTLEEFKHINNHSLPVSMESTSITAITLSQEKLLNTTSQPTFTPSTLFTTDRTTTPLPIFSTGDISINKTKLISALKPSTTTEININSIGNTGIADLDPFDVYHSLGQKHIDRKQQHQSQPKPTISLVDVFDSFADEELSEVTNYQSNQGFDSKGNLIEPLEPSKPAPFAMHGQIQYSLMPPSTLTTMKPKSSELQLNLYQSLNKEKLLSDSHKNLNNEYVSYQVQHPNIMKYRPALTAINNVVISPGQNSASFVLSNQQQVVSNTHDNGNNESPLLNRTTAQYGTVVNEEMVNNKHKLPIGNLRKDQNSNKPVILQKNSSFYQSGDQISNSTVNGHSNVKQIHTNIELNSFLELLPEPPSPYQQLPLIDSNLRPLKPLQHQQLLVKNTDSQSKLTFPISKVPPIIQSQKTTQVKLNDLRVDDTKELVVSTNIRFPDNEKESIDVAFATVGSSASNEVQINGHAHPISLQQLQSGNPVVFPKTKTKENSFPLADDSSDMLVQQYDVLTTNQHKQNLKFPSKNGLLEPPSQHMEPPPQFPTVLVPSAQKTVLHNNRPNVRSPSPPLVYNEHTRKAIPGIIHPNLDYSLPNILPQFRPNAKVSSSHHSKFNQEPGNIRIPGQISLKRPNHSPQFAHRRQPITQNKRYPGNQIKDYSGGAVPTSTMNNNRRVYHISPYEGQNTQYIERPKNLGYSLERHSPALSSAKLHEDIYKTVTPEKIYDFEEEDLVINNPPQPVTSRKKPDQIHIETNLEPVITLQMLQSQMKIYPFSNNNTSSGEINNEALSLIYPAKNFKISSINPNEEADNLQPSAHINALSGNEYQNTPFSVIRDQPQEPILTVKSKKPETLQQTQAKIPAPKEKFPYPIEKPDLSYSGLNPLYRVPGEVIAPRVTNGILSRVSEEPIAVAFTPTEPNHSIPSSLDLSSKFSNINFVTSGINEIRTDSQIPIGVNNETDLRGQNFENDFMAPFYPSLSLSNVAKTKPNSWSIFPSTTTDQSVSEKKKIYRADVGGKVQKTNLNYTETTTESFEIDGFKPELQGGFKPIYPPGYKDEHFGNNESDNVQVHESQNMSTALHISMKPLASLLNSSFTKKSEIESSSTSTTILTTTAKNEIFTTKLLTNASTTMVSPAAFPQPSQRKKSTFETSLAALLFGEDDELEYKVDRENTKAKSELQTIPGMGPRSLGLR